MNRWEHQNIRTPASLYLKRYPDHHSPFYIAFRTQISAFSKHILWDFLQYSSKLFLKWSRFTIFVFSISITPITGSNVIPTVPIANSVKIKCNYSINGCLIHMATDISNMVKALYRRIKRFSISGKWRNDLAIRWFSSTIYGHSQSVFRETTSCWMNWRHSTFAKPLLTFLIFFLCRKRYLQNVEKKHFNNQILQTFRIIAPAKIRALFWSKFYNSKQVCSQAKQSLNIYYCVMPEITLKG